MSNDIHAVDTDGGAAQAARPDGKRSRGLLLVGLFKIGKALFFGALAIGALNLIHKNVGDLVVRLVAWLHLNQTGRLASMVMDKADLIDGHRLRQAGMASFAYAVVCVIEGTGLLMEKEWAEYVTITLTAAALPWEVFEILRHFLWYKVGLSFLNLLVLLYLVWFVRRSRKMERRS